MIDKVFRSYILSNISSDKKIRGTDKTVSLDQSKNSKIASIKATAKKFESLHEKSLFLAKNFILEEYEDVTLEGEIEEIIEEVVNDLLEDKNAKAMLEEFFDS